MTPTARARLSRVQRKLHRERLEFIRSAQARQPMFPHATGKCEDCGSTLMSTIDVQLHLCVPTDRSHTRSIEHYAFAPGPWGRE